MARRRYQTGSLRDDGDRWELRWREDRLDPQTGQVKRVQRWDVLSKKSFPTKRLAQRELDRIVDVVNAIDYKPTTTGTFAQFAKKWQETILIHQKPSARDGSIIRVHLNPAFGEMSMREINTERLQGWVSSRTGMESKTVLNIMTTLRNMWKVAKAWDYVSHDPFVGLRLPKKENAKTYAFSLEECAAIIEALKEPWKTLVRIVAETGVRSGEVAGLRAEDFDPINLTLAVRQSVWNKQVQTPKTKSAYRREPVSAELAFAIGEVIKTARKNEYGLIFTGQTGEPLQMIHFINRVFRPLLKELKIWDKVQAMGIKKCGLHAFRRMSATEMDRQGVPLATRTARMGHANPNMTIGTYTKPIDEASRKFADRMGALLAPKGEGLVQ